MGFPVFFLNIFLFFIAIYICHPAFQIFFSIFIATRKGSFSRTVHKENNNKHRILQSTIFLYYTIERFSSYFFFSREYQGRINGSYQTFRYQMVQGYNSVPVGLMGHFSQNFLQGNASILLCVCTCVRRWKPPAGGGWQPPAGGGSLPASTSRSSRSASIATPNQGCHFFFILLE